MLILFEFLKNYFYVILKKCNIFFNLIKDKIKISSPILHKKIIFKYLNTLQTYHKEDRREREKEEDPN